MKKDNNPYNDSYLEDTLENVFESDDYYNVPNGIIRFDYSGSHGWWLRIIREGEQYSEFFSDNVYSSSEESLKASILQRHEVLSSFSNETTTFIHSRSLNPNPEERINFIDEPGKKQRYRAWVARWYDENHNIQRKNFSILKYGEAKAKALALETAAKNHNNTPKLTRVSDPHLKPSYEKISRKNLKKINAETTYTLSNEKIEEIDNPFAFEGGKKMVIHLKIERNQSLREKKIKEFTKKHGKLFCELCDFSFKDTYPFLEKDIIEVHHIISLANLKKSTKVKLSDLILLCSNCHFAIHQGDEEMNLMLASNYFKSKKDLDLK